MVAGAMPFLHGCCSKKLIFAGEALKEVEQMERSWQAQFPALPEALQGVLRRLIRADWRLEWTEQRVSEMEIALDPKPAAEWTQEDHKNLQLFYRYQTTADRAFHREWNLLKRVIRNLEFPHGVPPEYYWAAPEEARRGVWARYTFEVSLQKWFELAECEGSNGTGHLEPCEHSPTE